MDDQPARKPLIDVLRRAYSGELAAALAYRGHWKSCTRVEEIAGIKQIEEDEWVHRSGVGKMLTQLEARPSVLLEVRCWIIGTCLRVGCHLVGWFWPMYFAGRLESGNTVEYLNAAAYARTLGLAEFEQELLLMSAVEKRHEGFFQQMVAGHRLLPAAVRVFGWGALTEGAVKCGNPAEDTAGLGDRTGCPLDSPVATDEPSSSPAAKG